MTVNRLKLNRRNMIEMARQNAEMAHDQRNEDGHTAESQYWAYRDNVEDTASEYGADLSWMLGIYETYDARCKELFGVDFFQMWEEGTDYKGLQYAESAERAP